MKLSEHFQLAEFTYSETAIENHVINQVNEHYIIDNLVILCEKYLEPIRAELGCPIKISSGYRNAELNKLVGGSETSQHMTGEAADIYPLKGGALFLFNLIIKMVEEKKIPVPNQLIYYPDKNFVHIAHAKNPKGQYGWAGTEWKVFKLEEEKPKNWSEKVDERLMRLEKLVDNMYATAQVLYGTDKIPNKRE